MSRWKFVATSWFNHKSNSTNREIKSEIKKENGDSFSSNDNWLLYSSILLSYLPLNNSEFSKSLIKGLIWNAKRHSGLIKFSTLHSSLYLYLI